MIQIILNDGTKKRFTKIPKTDWKEFGFTKDDILHQKELTEDEITKIPDWSGNELIMRNYNQDELDIIQEIKNEKIEKQNILKKIDAGIKEILLTEGKITQEELDKIEKI